MTSQTIGPQYGSVSALTVTGLNSLASDTNYLAGWQSDEIDFSAMNTLGVFSTFVGGKIVAGSTATSGTRIEIWAAPCLDGANLYPDTITNGGQAAKTLTSANVKSAGLRLMQSITLEGTASRPYPVAFDFLDQFSFLPKKAVLFVTQGMGSALASSGHALNLVGANGLNT